MVRTLFSGPKFADIVSGIRTLDQNFRCEVGVDSFGNAHHGRGAYQYICKHINS